MGIHNTHTSDDDERDDERDETDGEAGSPPDDDLPDANARMIGGFIIPDADEVAPLIAPEADAAPASASRVTVDDLRRARDTSTARMSRSGSRAEPGVRRAERAARRAERSRELSPYRPTTSSSYARARDAQRVERSTRRETTVTDQARIIGLLRHPTREVSEAELRTQYSYVAADIRNMLLLALALIAALVVLAAVLPQ